MAVDQIPSMPLSYVGRLVKRGLQDIDLVVIHCTELPDLQSAREFGERIHYPESGTGNAGHVYIDRDGGAQCWIDVQRVAHHVRDFNERSVGIELVNNGRWPDWLHSERQVMTEPYPVAQVDALSKVLDLLTRTIPSLRWIAGHEQLDRERVPASDDPARRVYRKRDPGPLFPWSRVLSSTVLKRLPE